jgi:hypothetical protein
MGKAMAHMAVVLAELERDFIRSLSREALALRREHGVVLGRPRSTPDDVVGAGLYGLCAVLPRTGLGGTFGGPNERGGAAPV